MSLLIRMSLSLGGFLVTDNRVVKGPLGRSLPLFIPLTCSEMLASLACSIHSLAHSLFSLPLGTVEILKICVNAVNAFNGNNRVYCHQ